MKWPRRGRTTGRWGPRKMDMTTRLFEALKLLSEHPHEAANRLEALALRLLELAAALRQTNHSPSGMVDRVQMRVVGPNGDLKRQVDTNGGYPP